MFLLSGKLSGLPLVKFLVLFLSVTFPSGVYGVLLLFLDIFYRPESCSSEVSNKTFSTNTEPVAQRCGAIKHQLTLVSAEITLSDKTQHLPEINACEYAQTQFFIFGQDSENWVSNASKKDFTWRDCCQMQDPTGDL